NQGNSEEARHLGGGQGVRKASCGARGGGGASALHGNHVQESAGGKNLRRLLAQRSQRDGCWPVVAAGPAKRAGRRPARLEGFEEGLESGGVFDCDRGSDLQARRSVEGSGRVGNFARCGTEEAGADVRSI